MRQDPDVASKTKPFPVRSDNRRPWRYWLVGVFCRVAFRVWLRSHLVLEGFDRLPEEGPLIVAANHLSNLDPLLLGPFYPHTMFAMAKSELFGNRFMAWVLRGCNVFPVDRGHADRSALRMSLRLLKKRRQLLLFVEGTRSVGNGMLQAEPGVGFLVRHSRAPVLPVGLVGTDRVLGRGASRPRVADVTARVGNRFEVPESLVDDQEIADYVSKKIAELLPTAYRGYYAG